MDVCIWLDHTSHVCLHAFESEQKKTSFEKKPMIDLPDAEITESGKDGYEAMII